MVFSGVLHGVNPGLSPVSVVVDQSGTLVLDRENWVTTSGLPLELPQAPDGRRLEVVNSTTAVITVNSSPGTISGVTETGAAITAQNAVPILPGRSGTFVANGGNWIAQGCGRVLTFNYNGVPLSLNSGNPGSAGDLFHWLGQEAAKGTGQAWVNPAGTSQLVSVASSMVSGTTANFTDRVASGQNVHTANSANSWIGWQFPKPFICLGFVFQTRDQVLFHYPRSFSLRQNTGTTLSSGTDVSAWGVAGSWTNQVQINTPNSYHFFAAQTPFAGNQLALKIDGVGSNGEYFFCLQEVFLFGDYLV